MTRIITDTTAPRAPFVECSAKNCGAVHVLTIDPADWKPAGVYADLEAAGWSTDPSYCPSHRPAPAVRVLTEFTEEQIDNAACELMAQTVAGGDGNGYEGIRDGFRKQWRRDGFPERDKQFWRTRAEIILDAARNA